MHRKKLIIITTLRLPRQAVDNARLALEGLVDQLNDVRHNLLWFLSNHNILQVGAVEALSEPRSEKGLPIKRREATSGQQHCPEGKRELAKAPGR